MNDEFQIKTIKEWVDYAECVGEDYGLEVYDMKLVTIKKIKNAIHNVGKKIGINTTGIETDEGHDKSTATCWQCALIDELGIEDESEEDKK